MDKYEALKHYFGHTSFRQGQEALIDALLSGRDALGVMPTGGGKSLCYQIPALLLPGMTLVISPLISLMQDQVSALKKAGVRAAYLNSALTPDQIGRVYTLAAAGAYQLLYVAPERLGTWEFQKLCRTLAIPLVAVDEAHCISQWGQDFRPSYLQISDFLASLPRRPAVAAFTATATAEVQQDIIRLLALEDPFYTVTGFDRPNLFFDVQTPKRRNETLLALLEDRRGKSGIVYCATRAKVERVCQFLCDAGIAATRYHAGLSESERKANQDDFQFDRCTVMVATNAFGMGIDKSNVSFVIHYNMPKSLEAYYQEAGRAGRDGEPADCILFFSGGDVTTAKILLESGGNPNLPEAVQAQVHQQDLARLEAMTGYCRTSGCLRNYILDYFGQTHGDACGHCGNCRNTFIQVDITTEAQMILSCVIRVREKLGYYVGKSLILQVLRGSKTKRVEELGLERLSTYGLMRKIKEPQARLWIDYLVQEGYLRVNPLHATLEPTQAAGAVLFRGQQLTMPVRSAPETPREKVRTAPDGPVSEAPDGELFAALKALRFRLARDENVPAYIVFSNATLRDMAEKAPRTMADLLEVSGVGSRKAARYGAAFLEEIARHRGKTE